ncbi:GerAB/ArcD/ProY family transporter [Priestia koreensis]|uniref:Spore germination protein (Amino acid permease) n=1 Tax=Priestia koreensis TaxID=284581 RepID=A0A0M0L9B0_9BACI|nr:GerAB/ArcD/ProY family transporter [Priestia koreensis]KOO47619.1 hypothetical protein AMD01_06175 [Priestia koreensis]
MNNPEKQSRKATLTPLQVTAFIIQTQVGVGLLALPSQLHEKAKSDAWISVLIAGLCVQLLIFLFYFLIRRFPHANLFDMAQLILGKVFGKALNIVFAIYFICVAAYVLSMFNYIIQLWLYENTPQWFFKVLVVLTSLYLIKDRIKVIARFYVLMCSLLIVLVLIIINAYQHVNFLYLMPFGQSGFTHILSGSKEAVMAMLGFETLLVIHNQSHATQKQKLIAGTIGTSIVTIFYTFLVLTCLVFFSPDEIPLIPQPVLYVLKSLSFTFIERIDVIFLTIWVISVTTSYMSFVYTASLSLESIFKKKHTFFIWILGALSFCISLLLRNVLQIKAFGNFINLGGLVCCVGVPIFLYLVAVLFKKRQPHKESST